MDRLLVLLILTVSLGYAPVQQRAAVEATWGLDTIRALAEDPRNLVLPILQTRLEGFIEDASEYRAWAVKRSAPTGRIIATVPKAGKFYPAVIFYDSAGDERIGIHVNGVERGTAIANVDDNRQRVFFLTEAQEFRGGETIELRALTSQGLYRTEDLLLLAERPQPKRHDCAIRHAGARAEVEGRKAKAWVSWITTWPAACILEVAGRKLNEDTPLNNHRLAVEGLEAGRSYRYRITALDRDGKPVSSPWASFRAAEPTPPAGGSGGRVALTIAGVDGNTDRPVTSGVPFPKGALASDRQLRLLDAGGKEIALQTRTLGRWDDGSVKWALLDFETRQPAATLEYGPGVQRAASTSALKVSQTPEGIAVSTGPLQFQVSRKRFGLIESASAGGRPLISPERPGAFELVAGDGTLYSSLAAADELVVEEAGPVRAVIRATGRHTAADGRKLFAYTVRLHAWAGRPYLRVQHSFVNDGAGEFTTFRELRLRLPLAGQARRWALSGHSGEFPSGQSARLKQHTDDRYEVSGAGTAQGKRAEGLAEWDDGKGAVRLRVRDFWQNYPKDLAVSPGQIELGLCPPLRADEYESSRGTIDEHRIYYYLHGGVYKLREGVRKTHQFWLEFGEGGGGQRTFAIAPAGWYASSKALGELARTGSGNILGRYDAAFERSFEAYHQNRERNREYGMLNFGDWWGERIINWGNSEYDTQHAFFLQFARTGRLAHFLAGEEMEWHNRDIDAIHYSVDKMRLGAVYGHAIGHTGDYYHERPTAGAPPGGFAQGSPHSHFAVDHTFIEGHLDYYFLTGDRDSLETAALTANRYNTIFTRNYDFTNCRVPGWHLVLAMAMYNATNDPFHLNAARIVVERVLERQTPDGGWKRQMVPGHCFCKPRHMGNAGFMVAVLLTGLKSYHQATGDPRVADSIVKGAHFLINDMWMPEVKGFRYTSCPKSNKGAWSNFLLFDGISWAHQRTGDPKLRQVLVEGAGSALDTMTGMGKGFTQYTRVAPRFVGYLSELVEGR